MTIIEAINAVDNRKPNLIEQKEKIKWLSKLDGIVKTEIIDTHEGGGEITFSGYDANTDINTELLICAPYDDVYTSWLESKIDYAQDEYVKYNNSSMLFNTRYAEYQSYYNRTHTPKGSTFKYF